MPKLLSIGQLGEELLQSGWHVHPAWEICVFTEGEGVLQIGKTPVPFAAGTIICAPPAIPHIVQSTRGGLLHYMLIEGFVPSDPAIPVVRDSPDGIAARLAQQIHNEFKIKEPGWGQIAEQLLQTLLAYVDRWRGADHYPQVSQLKGLIMQGSGRHDFTLARAMKAIPASPDYLRRLFTRVTGETPMQYLTKLRIEEAKRLMRVLRLGVKEASRQAGFADPAYFARVFRKQTGLRPSEFIQSAHAGNAEVLLAHLEAPA
jgi:AraC-like DNA-binding protein